ncbi:MAG: MopE-related protein [Pseudomonadota bacterium]|nr:MopE-related protein [Pseudomonadota bacterium]
MPRARSLLKHRTGRWSWSCAGLVGALWFAACDAPEEDTAPAEVVLVDDDGDGWPLPLDCDDTLPGIHPGASELCNGSDDDCDGVVDDHPADGLWSWLDLDRDGWGDPATRDLWCGDSEDMALPWVTNDGDCDDGDVTIHPFAWETCDDPADEDCDGSANDPGASNCALWYEDLDGDGVGIERSSCLCEAEGNYRAEVDGDCDDEDDTRATGCGLSGARTLGVGDLAIIGADTMDFAGTSLAAAGDPDGDGWPDLLVGGSALDGAPPSWSLLRGPFDVDRDLRAPSATFSEATLSSAFSLLVAGGVDLDGDGGDELVLGAYGTVAGTASWAGVVYIIGGALAGAVDLTFADAHLVSARTPARHTMRLALSPDTDGDGLGDLLVGGTWSQSVWLFTGPLEGAFDPGAAACTLEGLTGDMGSSVASAGDVDGDGLADILAGLPSSGDQAEGAAWLVAGGTSGVVGVDDATAVLTGPAARAVAGVTVAGPGDVDGDGYDDVLVGGPADVDGVQEAGSVWLVRGPLSGESSLSSADARIDGVAAMDGAYVIQRVGDLDADGAADVVIGAPNDDSVADRSGAAFVFFGPVTGTARSTDAQLRLYGTAAGDAAGTVVSSAGDLDLDGYLELLVGAPGIDLGGLDAGGAFVVHGGAR